VHGVLPLTVNRGQRVSFLRTRHSRDNAVRGKSDGPSVERLPDFPVAVPLAPVHHVSHGSIIR